jgi:hypothetical protein
MMYLSLYISLSENFDMVSCPKCGAEFPPKDMWTEVFQAVESETGKRLNKYVIFSFPECHVFLDMKAA